MGTPTPAEVRIIGLPGFQEVKPGDDVGAMLLDYFRSGATTLEHGDILVVTHKVISKSEGRLIDLKTVEPSTFAIDYAKRFDKDARHVEVVLHESARIVRMDHGVIIAETRHGFICANAGVDASNVAGEDSVCLLPLDSDASAATLRSVLSAAFGFDVPVIITDSFGRPWRDGITNIAIGISGLLPFADYRGEDDAHGMTLKVSMLAVADEIAAASELVMGKLAQVPFAIVRGYPYTPGEGSARQLVRDPSRDMFR